MTVRQFVFANGYISALGSGGLLAGDTDFTPVSTTGVPVCDPTLPIPTVMPLLIDTNAVTGLPTSVTEIVYVVDNRTTPWQLERAVEDMLGGVVAGVPIDHPSGARISGELTAGVLQQLAEKSLLDDPLIDWASFTDVTPVMQWNPSAGRFQGAAPPAGSLKQHTPITNGTDGTTLKGLDVTGSVGAVSAFIDIPGAVIAPPVTPPGYDLWTSIRFTAKTTAGPQTVAGSAFPKCKLALVETTGGTNGAPPYPAGILTFSGDIANCLDGAGLNRDLEPVYWPIWLAQLTSLRTFKFVVATISPPTITSSMRVLANGLFPCDVDWWHR